MKSRTGTAVAVAATVVVAAVALLGSGGSPDAPQQGAEVAGAPAAPVSAPAARSEAARVGCRARSEANFPGGFTSRRNLVVGPLALIGAANTDAETVRRSGGNKFPLLVRAGHTVTIRVAARARREAGLAYGRLPQGKVTLRDTRRSLTFVTCRPGRPPRRYRPNGPSASSADGVAVTFWSGAVLTRGPSCIPLEIYLDDAASPKRVGLSLGRRCER
jgi:hypothetical protein